MRAWPSGTVSNPWALLLVGRADPVGHAVARRLALHGTNLCIAIHGDERGGPHADWPMERLRELGVSVMVFTVDPTSLSDHHWILDELCAATAGRPRVRVVVHSPFFTRWRCGDGCGAPICRLAVSLALWTQGLVARGILEPHARVIPIAAPPRPDGVRRRSPGPGTGRCPFESVSRALGLVLGSQGVRMNLLVPRGSPTAPVTRPRDVARAVQMLCSEASRWTNGEVLHVAGGDTLRAAAEPVPEPVR